MVCRMRLSTSLLQRAILWRSLLHTFLASARVARASCNCAVDVPLWPSSFVAFPSLPPLQHRSSSSRPFSSAVPSSIVGMATAPEFRNMSAASSTMPSAVTSSMQLSSARVSISMPPWSMMLLTTSSLVASCLAAISTEARHAEGAGTLISLAQVTGGTLDKGSSEAACITALTAPFLKKVFAWSKDPLKSLELSSAATNERRL
mmetsp:Transcript_22228/g.32291  ORF Transcript_22228/g.32291 Transcript_22228/m.32291 type:complete len:204 (-) Transcript_22228:147-758(-)